MTRMRQPHNFHEVKEHSPETRYIKCGTETPHVCEWCGACKACHIGGADADRY
ncbi:MAG: hypothetical protein ABI347_01780 [Nitrososphaera sp.]